MRVEWDLSGYRIGWVFRPVYRTPPFDKGTLLFPLGNTGGELSSILVVRFIEMCMRVDMGLGLSAVCSDVAFVDIVLTEAIVVCLRRVN